MAGAAVPRTQAAGIACPRDSDMQAAFGTPVSFSGDLGALRSGDLVCWKGHIGIGSGCVQNSLHTSFFSAG